MPEPEPQMRTCPTCGVRSTRVRETSFGRHTPEEAKDVLLSIAQLFDPGCESLQEVDALGAVYDAVFCAVVDPEGDGGTDA